ncbi:MAG TPA: SMR family transporter [Microbacteriaceae bacterium]|nr:SMR family transporter [Microbacteriaceae bacterium]
MAWVWLAGAVIFEVTGTLSLRMASLGKKLWFIGVAVGYLASFTMLILALAGGMHLGVAYGIWTATGVVLTAVLSKIFFKEPLSWLMGLGIVLIVGGVLLIEVGSVQGF